ncbi:hypothetical protein ACFLTG_02735 [Chloroflexota bacterium]
MYILRTVLKRSWSPILITALAILGYVYEWGVWVMGPALFGILVIGLIIGAVRAREKQLEVASIKLRQLAGYFNRRFTGNSSLSIFAIINSLFKVDNPPLWDWARACDVAQRIFNTWCSGFINRVESDIRMRRFDVYLRTYLNEMWLVNSHYYEFIEQFYEIAQNVEIPRETRDQYNRFVSEYNVFVQNFRDSINELRQTARTEIEAPSVMTARELTWIKTPQTTREEEAKRPKERPKDSKGYYLI